jgi:hypothetical protein
VKETGELSSFYQCPLLLSKYWVPSLKCFSKFIIEHASADLQQQVGALLAAAHLLLFYHSLAHHLVDGRLHKRGGMAATLMAGK